MRTSDPDPLPELGKKIKTPAPPPPGPPPKFVPVPNHPGFVKDEARGIVKRDK